MRKIVGVNNRELGQAASVRSFRAERADIAAGAGFCLSTDWVRFKSNLTLTFLISLILRERFSVLFNSVSVITGGARRRRRQRWLPPVHRLNAL